MKASSTRPFGAEIERFLAFKRGMGFKYVAGEETLRKFQRFCEAKGFAGPDLTEEVVCSWCEKLPCESRSHHAGRVAVIRQFAFYMSSVGRDAHVPMNVATGSNRRARYSAYVFTRDEIAAVMDACDRICPHKHSTMHLVFPTIIRFLYSTGARVEEALSVQMADVDLESGAIRLTNAKNGKVRLVALSETMNGVLVAYCGILHPDPSPEDYLFRKHDGGRYRRNAIYDRFREALAVAGIPHGGRGSGPRVHDLRHTFACHSLMRVHEGGGDVRAMLPVLSVYLGHESVKETERYLKMTAEVFPSVTELVERACSHVIPEVDGDAQGSY